MQEVSVDDDSRLQLHDLVLQKQGDEYILGRKATGAYLTTNQIGVETLSLLSKGLTIREVKSRIASKYGEAKVELKDLLHTVLETGVAKTINGKPVEATETHRFSIAISLRPEKARILFSKPLVALYITVCLTASVILFLEPQYLPALKDIRLSDRLLLVIVCAFGAGTLSAFLHELGHALAARSVGASARIELASRFFFTITQTAIPDLWFVPKAARVRVYLTGLATDGLLASLLIIGLFLLDSTSGDANSFFYRLLKFMLFGEALKIAWQFCIFLRTDLYYVLVSLAGFKSLHSDAISFLKGFTKNFGWSDWRKYWCSSLMAYSTIQRVVIVFYSALATIAVAVLSIFLLLMFLPAIFKLISGLFRDGLTNGAANIPLGDRLLFLFLLSINFILPLKKLLQKKKPTVRILCE